MVREAGELKEAGLLTNFALSRIPAMRPAMKVAQLNWVRSTGRETKIFVIGLFS
jgi:hypothetical protein